MSLLVALALASAVTGRLPGTSQTVDGLRVVPAAVRVVEDAGIVRTEREDLVENATAMQLEARYVVHIPRGAALTRVALDVDGTLIEGEVLGRARASEVFHGIVDRPAPRDPALVERLDDGAVQVKIFPVPGHGARRIVLGYDEAAPAPAGGDALLTLGKKGFVLRIPGVAAADAAPGPTARAIVVDASRGQTPPRAESARAIARELAAALAPGDAFAILVCDSACASFPAAGLAKKGDGTSEELTAWLAGAATRGGGSRDVAGAVAEAAGRVGRGGQIVWLGGGRATSGPLQAREVAASVRASLGSDIELRAVGIDDTGELAALAKATGASFEEAGPGLVRASDASAVARRLRSSSVRAPLVDLPNGLSLTGALPERLVGGDSLVVMGTFQGEPRGDVTVRGTVQGRPVAWTHRLQVLARDVLRADTLLAQARVDALEARGDPLSVAAAADLARAHRVLAKGASWLVLENDEMFEQNGIARTGRPKARSPATVPAAPGSHVTTAPVLRQSFVQVNGRLPAERIQHVVRMNQPRVRFCYEQGLRASPTLAGRVSVKFVIDGAGLVAAATDGGSDLPDRDVIACIVDAFREMTFPIPEGGLVTVVYPFALTPAPGTKAGPMVLPLRVPPSATPDPHTLWRLRTQVEENPSNHAAHAAYLDALLRAGQRDAARDAAESFVRQAPDALAAYHALIALASPARTATALDALTDLSPWDALLHERAAAALAAAGDPRRAASHRASVRALESSR